MNRKLLTSMLIIVMAIAAMAGGTLAWFTAESGPVENVFVAGTVSISADETVAPPASSLENWNPGDCDEKEFEIENDGTKGIYLRTYLTAKWEGVDPGEAPDLFDWLTNYNVTIVSIDYDDDQEQDSESDDYYDAWQFVPFDGTSTEGQWVIGNYDEDTGVFTANPNGTLWYTGYWYHDGNLAGSFDGPADVAYFRIRVCLDGTDTGNEYQGATFTLSSYFEAIQSSNEASNAAWGMNYDEGTNTWSAVTP